MDFYRIRGGALPDHIQPRTMRSVFSLAMLALGSLIFVTAWAMMVGDPDGFESPGWIAVGVFLAILAWSVRGQYEPLTMLAAGSYVGTASLGIAIFNPIAASGGGGAGIVQVYELIRNAFGCSVLLAVLAIVRTWTARAPRRSLVIAWVVIIQGSWWAWVLEAYFVTACRLDSNWTEIRGRAAYGFVLAGSLTLAVFVVGWLRRTTSPKLARFATSIATVTILGMWAWGCTKLQTDEEIYAQWDMPASTSCEVVSFVDDVWIPRVRITESGGVVISRYHYGPDEVREWLAMCAKDMLDDARLYLTADASASFGAVLPFLRACLASGQTFEELFLVVRDPRPAHTWREVAADVVRLHHGRIPLSLAAAAPVGLPEFHLGADGEDLESQSLSAAALRIDPQVTMERVVASLDRLRAQGCTRIHVLVGSD